MIDYNKGKIYKIIDYTTNDVYFGSTTKDTLAQRLTGHVSDYKQYKIGKRKNKSTSFKIIDNNNYYIILVELFACGSKDQLTARERYYIENYECVNKVIPGQTHKEWRIKNRININQTTRLYRLKHTDTINESKRNKYKYFISWGGNKKHNNNLLCIDPFLFT